VALLSPDQNLADVFKFIVVATRPPNQLKALAAPTNASKAQLEEAQAKRRAALRNLAVSLATPSGMEAFSAAPPTVPLAPLPPSVTNTMG
jgi:hypothetical protein